MAEVWLGDLDNVKLTISEHIIVILASASAPVENLPKHQAHVLRLASVSEAAIKHGRPCYGQQNLQLPSSLYSQGKTQL